MSNAFTQTYSRRFAGSNNKSLAIVKGLLVIDTTATGGATAGDLPASMFGMQKIFGCMGAVLSDNSTIYFGVPAYDDGSLLIGAGAANAPMDLPNGTYNIALMGQA